MPKRKEKKKENKYWEIVKTVLSFIRSIHQKQKRKRVKSFQTPPQKAKTKTEKLEIVREEISLKHGREEPLTTGAILKELGITPLDLKRERRRQKEANLKKLDTKEETETTDIRIERELFNKRLPPLILEELVKKGRFSCERNLHIGDIRGLDIIERVIVPGLKTMGIKRNNFSINRERNPKITLTDEGRKKLAAILAQDGIFYLKLP